MVNKTPIEWTDYSSNPVRFRRKSDGRVVHGCVKVSPGCAHCYAESIAKRFEGGEFSAEAMKGLDVFLDEKELRSLLSVRKLPEGSMVFVGDMTDVFGEWVPFEYLDRLFAVFALRPDVVFQVLTKRPERMRRFLTREYPNAAYDNIDEARDGWFEWDTLPDMKWPLPNVWLGTSVENQRWADIRVPELLATPAAVRFVSYEPALGRVLFDNGESSWLTCNGREHRDEHCVTRQNGAVYGHFHGIDWIIVGGESGPGARPFDVECARSVVEQCRAAGVACFVKQMGTPWALAFNVRSKASVSFGQTYAVSDPKGGSMALWPADLRVREFPAVSGQRSAISGVSS